MKITNPPETEEILLARANEMAGLSLSDIATVVECRVPENFKRHKGFTGQLIECFLGANAGNKAKQDFADLGIELKTIPLSCHLTPLETTYVCYAPLVNLRHISWDNSSVKNKLQKVLWIPIEGERAIPPKDRKVGSPILWEPTKNQQLLLRQDWEELMELIVLGKVESITAKIGEVLQLRPKAADGNALTDAIGIDGRIIKTRPRGFYLRKQFTQQILEQAFY